jgi:hypothetical protein
MSRTFRFQLFFAAILLTISAATASAATIANLATGLNGSGTLQTVGNSVDAHWIYNNSSVTPATGSAKVVAPNNANWGGSSWVVNGPGSSWIAADPDNPNNGPAPYSFTYKFDTTGYLLSSLAITGAMWTIDDAGTLTLNGTLISTLGNGNWVALSPFAVPNSAFLNGINTLTITIAATDQFLEGVRLEVLVTGTSIVPEPSTFLLIIPGLMLLSVRHKLRPQTKREA